MSERSAEQLAPAQAAELAAVIDSQARWENMRCDPPHAGDNSSAALQARQKAYDAFRTRLAAYTARYRTVQIPETTLNGPERVGVWCRTVRAVLRRAESEAKTDSVSHTVSKAYRLVNRIAARLKLEPVERSTSTDGIAGAIRSMDVLIGWCDDLAGPPAIIGSVRPVESAPMLVHERVA